MRSKERRKAESPSDPPAAASSARAKRLHEPNSGAYPGTAFIGPERRRALIAEAAYYRAERRGFGPGHELEDWNIAESEVDGMLARGEIPVA
jgi:hypothetical protein